MSGIPVSKEKLLLPGTKSPVLTEEKNVGLLAELINTFCPERGSVLDIYGGTFTTGIASLRTARSCVVIESSASTFRLAHERLRAVAEILYRKSPSSHHAMKKRKTRENSKAESSGEITKMIEKSSTIVQSGNDMLKGGDRVELLLDGITIGHAKLLSAPDNDSDLHTSIHNVPLSEYEKDGQKLVACYSFKVKEDAGDKKYPYGYGGIEKPPGNLKGLAGIFSWDIHSMRCSN